MIPYSLPTLTAFAESDWIVDVVIGTVMSTESKAMGAGDVATVLTIDVEASRDRAGRSSTLTVRESGGIVTRGEMREADIEAGVAVELPASASAELDRTSNEPVDSVANGQKHSEVGQRVLLFVAGEATDHYVAVRLVQRPDGTFDWYGEPMNDEWDVQVDTAEATVLFALR